MELSTFLKDKRKQTNLTQQDLAEKAGVGLRFVRELEQGKTTLRIDKVNQVLRLFGHELSPTEIDREKLLSYETRGSKTI
ncbi:MAG: helix-turn-helix transcriptional regulator [Paludibacter sp.]|jgi:y4mF family transcriptional regulator|nr:helix-turn-helix transcriptional regulator [Paludibacter sp.]